MIHDTYEKKWIIIFLLNPSMILHTYTSSTFSHFFFLTEVLVKLDLLARTPLHTYDEACHLSPMFYRTTKLENAFSEF